MTPFERLDLENKIKQEAQKNGLKYNLNMSEGSLEILTG